MTYDTDYASFRLIQQYNANIMIISAKTTYTKRKYEYWSQLYTPGKGEIEEQIEVKRRDDE